MFDVDDTMYDQQQPFRNAVKRVVPLVSDADMHPLYIRFRHHSDENFPKVMAGDWTLEYMRAHRIGQKNVVEVWRMISEGTIEERMDSLQQEKRELFQKVIQGNEEQLTKLTEEDIRMILSVGEIEE